MHVVMFPFFAFGHISPFAQLSNKLSSHGIRISFFSAAGNLDGIKPMLTPTPTTQFIPLTIPPVAGLPPGLQSTADVTTSTSELLKVALDLMQPQIHTLLSHLRPHFILFDFANHWIPALASQLGIKSIFFSIFATVGTAFCGVPARLGATVEDMKKPPPGFPQTSVTSLKTFEARDAMGMFTSFHGCASVYDRFSAGYNNCSTAILLKTCNEMEAPYVDYIKTQFDKPVLLAGPVVPEPRTGELDQRWAVWLDQFPPNSVIYCSFGSETFLTDDQIKEVALGLDLTGLPFFLVLNFPAYTDSAAELQRALPEGFLERVKGKGVVHTGWVQQQHILAHNSVGCYVCHAGLSSITEGLVNDCQLVTLPLRVDQFMNSKLVGLELKAGVEVYRKDEDGSFGKEDVCEAIKTVMVEVDREPGKSIAANHKKWREFMLNQEIHTKFVTDLVMEMKAMLRK